MNKVYPQIYLFKLSLPNYYPFLTTPTYLVTLPNIFASSIPATGRTNDNTGGSSWRKEDGPKDDKWERSSAAPRDAPEKEERWRPRGDVGERGSERGTERGIERGIGGERGGRDFDRDKGRNMRVRIDFVCFFSRLLSIEMITQF